MNNDRERNILRLALIGLEAERVRIERQLRELDGPQTQVDRLQISAENVVKRSSPNKGKRMSEEQKRKISNAMKARWSSVRGRRGRGQR